MQQCKFRYIDSFIVIGRFEKTCIQKSICKNDYFLKLYIKFTENLSQKHHLKTYKNKI